jgi:succinoglycan biosynthesis transport protein ExoP
MLHGRLCRLRIFHEQGAGNLSDLPRAVRQQWQLIAVTVFVVLLVAGVLTIIKAPTYRASVQLFVTAQVELNPSAGSQFAMDQVRSYAVIVSSPTVTAPVIEKLQLKETPAQLAGRMSAEVPADTAVLNVFVDDASARTAAEIANAVSEQLVEVATELQTAEGQQAPVKVTVVKPASVPTGPESPKPVNNLLLALFLGLGLGLGLALVRDSGGRQAHSPVASDAPTVRRTSARTSQPGLDQRRRVEEGASLRGGQH